MAIAFVNGAVSTFATNTTQTVTFSPTAGNTVILSAVFGGSVTGVTCQDNTGVSLFAGPSLISAGVPSAIMFYYQAGSGVTSFTISWTTTRTSSISVVQYSGGGVTGPLATSTATGTSGTASIAPTTTFNNAFVVACLGDTTNVMTVTSGTQRTSAAGTPRMVMADGTSASPGVVTISATLTSSAWVALAVQIAATTRVTQIAVEASVAPTDGLVRVTQIATEASVAPTDSLVRVTQIAVETSIIGAPQIRVTQIAVETSIQIVPAPTQILDMPDQFSSGFLALPRDTVEVDRAIGPLSPIYEIVFTST